MRTITVWPSFAIAADDSQWSTIIHRLLIARKRESWLICSATGNDLERIVSPMVPKSKKSNQHHNHGTTCRYSRSSTCRRQQKFQATCYSAGFEALFRDHHADWLDVPISKQEDSHCHADTFPQHHQLLRRPKRTYSWIILVGYFLEALGSS